MIQNFSLSDYNKTLVLLSIIEDREANIICSDAIFENILHRFLNNLQSNDDKQLAIKHLMQILPNNDFLIEQKQLLDKSSPWKIKNFWTDFGLKRNLKVYQLYEQLNIIRLEEDCQLFNELLLEKDFFEFCQYPLSLKKVKPIIVKLRRHCFKLVDLIEHCKNKTYQVNASMVRNLIFFFFIPAELQISNQERIDLFAFIGEILQESWLQFEYNLQFIMPQKQISDQQQILEETSKIIKCDLNSFNDCLEQTIKSLIGDQNIVLTYTIVDNLIQHVLPVNQEIQKIFYWGCLFCLNFFNLQNESIVSSNLKTNEIEKNKILSLYIKQRKQSSSYKIQNFKLEKLLKEYTLIQNDIVYEWGNHQTQTIEQLLKTVIEENFHYYNKMLHIAHLHHQYAKILNLFSEIPEDDARKVAQLLQQLVNEDEIIDVIVKLQQSKECFPQNELELIFRILCEVKNVDFNEFQDLKEFIFSKKNKAEIKNQLKISKYDERMEFEQQMLMLNQFTDDVWLQIRQDEAQQKIFNSLMDHFMNQKQENYKEIFPILRKLLYQNSALEQKNHWAEIFSLFFRTLQDEQIFRLISDNKSKKVPLDNYINSVGILIQVFTVCNSNNEVQKIRNNLENKLQIPNEYCLQFLLSLLEEKYQKQLIENIYKLIYYWQYQAATELKQCAQEFYRMDQQIYTKIFSKINYFQNQQLSADYLEKQLKSDIYPRNLNITLEEFNISLTQLDKKQQQELVKEWILNIKDSEKFKQLIPFFFNIIKRGESSAQFLSIINQQIKNNKGLSQEYGYFNQKSIFQIFYNNANDELKVMLLKLMSKQHPVSLLYRTPFNAQTGESEKLTFNINTFYVYQENFPIINLSLDPKQRRIGKTQLINKIFYQTEKFEISDSNQLNKQTIDVMYDFEFSGSRNLSVADVHSFIPYEILDDILPMFKMWIVQVDQEKEIDSTIEALKQLKSFPIQDKIVCLLIRNSNENLEDRQIKQLQSFNIQYKQVVDLSNNDLNKQMMDDEIEQVSKFLYDQIDQNRKQNTLNQEQYFNFICKMKNQNLEQTVEIVQALELFQEIEKELEIQMIHQDGFYNKNSFPLRSIDWNIKQEKESYMRIQQDKEDQQKQEKLVQINKRIDNLKQEIKFQQPTKILMKFCDLLQKPNYYILYLHFVDKIRKFNEKNTYDLQDKNQKLNEEILQLKKEREALKTTDKDILQINEKNQQKELKQQQIDSKISLLKQNSEIIAKRNIGIELFWREIISQIEMCNDSQINIDPAQVVKEMIQKGEPYEFLDGDSLKIDQKFLSKLIKTFNNQGKEKILVLSVLGPQSSGKSTILNKIFGCHFWTSVGRCTKGIYLQLLKIHNKAFFNFLFDYIIILDSEGLQSPNQEDQEFDKKIALFVLSISDIILVNVKGDITKEFKSLVEMCIFTLGQMKSFSSSKQITWCFNQNNDVNNYAPFLAQLQSIASSLNTEFTNSKEADEAVDYNDILGITQDNIKILGFASTEKLWRKDENNGIFSDWRQLIINGTFSEEAYLYGIKVIKSYVEKFGDKTDQQETAKEMEDLQYFIQKIETTWQSIQSLPDLLEFSELIQHQQNQFMRQQFTQLMNAQQFPQKFTFIGIIVQLIKDSKQNLTLPRLQEIYNEQISSMKGQFDLIKNEFIDKLISIKNEKKISKKVFTKYVNMIKDRINSEMSAISLDIYSEIKTQETTFQKKKGFTQIDDFIQKLVKNEKELQTYKDNENLIQQKFQQIWKSIIDEQTQQQEVMFKEFCDKLFIIIQQEFQKYILKTSKENDYKSEFLQKLIKFPPCQQDFSESLKILRDELHIQQFMIAERSNKNYNFYENFMQSIEKKLQNSPSNQILTLNKFYQYKIIIKWISKKDLIRYMQTDMINDLDSYYTSNKKLDKYAINNFLSYFKIFGFDILEDKVEKLFEVLNKWFKNDQKPQMLLACFTANYQLQVSQIDIDLSMGLIKQSCKNFTKYLQQKEVLLDLFDNSQIDELLLTYSTDDNYIYEFQKYIVTLQKLEQIIPDYGLTTNQQWQSQSYIQPKTQYTNTKLTYSYQSNYSYNQTPNYQVSSVRNVFDYILNQKQNYHLYPQFKSNIAQIVQQQMKENQYYGWSQMYSVIYKMILDEVINNKMNATVQNNEDVKVNQYSFSLIKRIMQKIEVEIKDFNMQFSNYGVILNDIGERCLFYYAIFTIWRILCFGQWKSAECNIKELDNQTQEQYIKFKADIQQNKTQQSKIRGQNQAVEILNQAIQRLYLEYQKEATKIVAEYNTESSFDLIKRLDKQILERQDKNISEESILNYIRNQTKYIENYVKQKTENIKSEIQQKLTQKFRSDLKTHLQWVEQNTQQLSKVTTSLQAAEYFKKLENPDSAPGLLYSIVLNCLQGQAQESQLLLIRQELREVFLTDEYFHVFNIPICTPIQSSSDAEIQILFEFIVAFKKKISELINGLDKQPFDFKKLNIQSDLDALQLKQIGCLECCPICKRKCDQEIDDNNHRHQCKNGHQLRGMSGVLIGCHPSLYTCEEIQDDFQIQELQTGAIKLWKEIKAIYNTWIFSCLTKDELKLLKEKFMKIWNHGIGIMLCQQLQQEIGQEVFYAPKQEVDLGQNKAVSRTAHYIIMLDDSGSMEGNPFDSAKAGIIAFLYEINKNPNSRITIIIFNSTARCVVDFQAPNPQAQEKLITFKDGGTDFNRAFQLAYEKIAQNPEFDKFQSHSMFFYTDGGASYPATALDKFKQLPPEKRAKIELMACSIEQNPQTLIKVVDFFRQYCSNAELKNQMLPQQIAQIWIEVVSQVTHNIKKKC